MRTTTYAALAILFASTTLAACGDDDEAGTPAGSTSSTSGSGGGGGGSGGDGGSGGGLGGSGGDGGSGGTGGSAAVDILDQLRAIDGAEVTEETSEIDGYRFFTIELDQPVDHDDPSGPHFKQRLALHHRDASAPLVLAATGYALWLPYQYLEEPSALLNANQIFVEHRFFTPSRPEPADWTKLTIKQAAADHHHIVEAFRPLYAGPWISTGASKGGMTSIYHRRFYPSDVDVTVAYVAPLSYGYEDPRYIDFLNQVGDADCREHLTAFQREVLLRKPQMLERAAAQAQERGITFNLFGLEPTLEDSVTWLPFGFWQYSTADRCAGIPAAGASDDEVWQFLDEISGVSDGADDTFLQFEPYYWQSSTELGGPTVDTSAIDDLLTATGNEVDELPSIDIEPEFLPEAMQDVARWTATEGSRLLFIYGENDPWSAGAFDLGASQETYRYTSPGGNHGSGIYNLTPTDAEAALATLQAWTGVAIQRNATALRGPRRLPPRTPRPRHAP